MPENNRSDLRALLSDLLSNKKLTRKYESYAGKLLFKRSEYAFARHILPSDIVSSIILKLLTGDITWNIEKSSFDSFFYSKIRTEIFNLIKKEKKFIPVQFDRSETFSDYEGEIEDDIPLPLQLIIDPFNDDNDENKIDILQFRNIAFEIFQDSPDEYLVLDAVCSGHQTKQITLDLGLSKDEVHNIKRRIIRVLKSWAKRNIKPQRFPDPPRFSQPHPQRFSDPNTFGKNHSDPHTFSQNQPGKTTLDNNNNGELL